MEVWRPNMWCHAQLPRGSQGGVTVIPCLRSTWELLSNGTSSAGFVIVMYMKVASDLGQSPRESVRDGSLCTIVLLSHSYTSSSGSRICVCVEKYLLKRPSSVSIIARPVVRGRMVPTGAEAVKLPVPTTAEGLGLPTRDAVAIDLCYKISLRYINYDYYLNMRT